jgi:hypothetical protein
MDRFLFFKNTTSNDIGVKDIKSIAILYNEINDKAL